MKYDVICVSKKQFKLNCFQSLYSEATPVATLQHRAGLHQQMRDFAQVEENAKTFVS